MQQNGHGSADPQDSPQVDPSTSPLGAEHIRFVERVLAKKGLRGETLQDARQEVLLSAYRARASFRGESSLETWLHRICVHEAQRQLRKARSPAESASCEMESVAPDPLTAAMGRQTLARLARALQGLSESKRTALHLYAIEDLSMKEVAEAQGCALQTAYSRVQAARSEIAALLNDEPP